MSFALRFASMARRAATSAHRNTVNPFLFNGRNATATTTPRAVLRDFSTPADLWSRSSGMIDGTRPYSSRSFGLLGPDGLPISVDWRERGAVTEVSSQGKCGSCWAFGTTATVEGLNFIETDELVKLSEQQLIDCCNVSCRGCSGGTPRIAFQYIINNGGQVSYDDYPYEERQNPIHKPLVSMGVTIDKFLHFTNISEFELKRMVAVRPVVVTVCADKKFIQYQEGVLNGPNYTMHDMWRTKRGHYVTVVGYGVTDLGVLYWLIKNSWGKKFGLDGYIMIARENGMPGGAFGIARYVFYPVKFSTNKLCRVKSEKEMRAAGVWK